MTKSLSVIGAGIAGLSASLAAAKAGIPVTLIEKEGSLGGFAAGFCCKATDSCAYCCACVADEILREVTDHPGIEVHLGSTVEQLSGGENGFALKLSGNGTRIEASAIVLATGFKPFDPAASRSATAIEPLPDIVSAVDIEKMLREEGKILRPSDGSPPEKVAFIQCVGSRSRRFGSPECSRVCCPYAIRIARRIKWQQPDCALTVFHMDLQGIRKIALDMYKEFGGEIEFVRGIPAEAVEGIEGGVVLKYEDTLTGQIEKKEYDIVVLSTGIAPHPDAGSIAETFGLERDATGFLKPASVASPHLSGKNGIFLAGACTGPLDIRNAIAQGRAAAHAALDHVTEMEG